MEETVSDKLRSHTWEVVTSEEWKLKPKYKKGIDIHEFSCKNCGETSYGSSKGPTVWATYVARMAEPLSCDDVTVKDIIL